MVTTSITGTTVFGLPRLGGPASPWWACLALAGLPAS
jgi:hypothetical protein